MARAFRPQMHVMDARGRVEVLTYPTYRELKKDIPNKIVMDHDEDGLFVVRHRRGEWGEWFERWETCGVKPTGEYRVMIKRQGWS